MRKLLFTTFLLLAVSGVAFAQPANDECTGAVNIPDVTNFCSASGAFTNVGATPSNLSAASCFSNVGGDVWFTFTATATDVTILVRGATAIGSGGTLQDPQVALYLGVCGVPTDLDPLNCESSGGSNNIAELYQGGLFVGATYTIRVQGANDQSGTFQICVNNYNPPADPESDCPQAAILCDKSPFNVQNVVGAGNNISEINDASCFGNGSSTNYETNSTWFTWTCSVSGTLEFTLTPGNGPDDLDFVLYRLPNGIHNCAGKQVVRCMASGQSQGVNSAPCLGPTGLRAGDPDISEDAGCSETGDDAWLAPLDMVAGETYALCVNNFSSTGNGFSVEFGGSGQFLGPEANFTTVPAAICLGTPVEVTDASTFALGAITAWQWSFGINGSPITATGPGPHTVQFDEPGIQSVVLTLETDLGCKVTAIRTVNVFPDVEVDTVLAVPDCNGGTNGAIEITNIESGTPPYQFSWNGGPFTSDNTLTGLPQGTYSLVIKDANNCETDLEVEVKEKELTVDADVTPPLCTDDLNGVIELTVTNGTAPFQFNWGAGYQNNNVQGGFSEGVYTILGLDAELCRGTFVVTVTDHAPVTVTLSKVDISCFGANDGVIMADASGGVGNFTYQWSNGATTEDISNLGPGVYSVTVRDGNDCAVSATIEIIEPIDVGVDLIGTVDLLCNGVPEGQITVQGVNGSPGYQYSANGVDFQDSPTLTGLAAGDYQIYVRDSRGCIDSVAASLMQPPALVVLADPVDTLVNLGFTVQITTTTGPSGRPVTYQWTPALGMECTDCPNPLVTGTETMLYVIKITDETGCMAFDTVSIRVNKERPVYFPNIFHPDVANYPNDHFTGFSGPAGDRIDLLRVYDRWGDLVFENHDFPLNDPALGWDGLFRGKKADSGVYTWYALVRFADGVVLEYKGNVTLLR
jgi:hypothetical protein